MMEFKLIGVSVTCPERADRSAPQILSFVQAQLCSQTAVGVGGAARCELPQFPHSRGCSEIRNNLSPGRPTRERSVTPISKHV